MKTPLHTRIKHFNKLMVLALLMTFVNCKTADTHNYKIHKFQIIDRNKKTPLKIEISFYNISNDSIDISIGKEKYHYFINKNLRLISLYSTKNKGIIKLYFHKKKEEIHIKYKTDANKPFRLKISKYQDTWYVNHEKPTETIYKYHTDKM